MPKLKDPSSALEKLKELNRQYIDTKSIAIIMDCSISTAIKMKKQVQSVLLSSGKILPHQTKVPTTSVVKILMIDEKRIRFQAEEEMRIQFRAMKNI